MTGVDLSRPMIQEAQGGAAGARVTVEWHTADMRELPWESEFDAAFSFGNSFGYLDEAGTRAFVRAVCRALKPGARFALDYGLAAEGILPRLREREWAQVEDILFLEHNLYHVPEGCVETTYTFVRDGEAHTRKGLQWVFTVREILGFLREAGLETQGLYRSLDDRPFEIGSPCLFLVAQKAGAPRNTA